MKIENLQRELEYLKPIIILSDSPIKSEDLQKKKNAQYTKFKTIPKWHHYSWDMIK